MKRVKMRETEDTSQHCSEAATRERMRKRGGLIRLCAGKRKRRLAAAQQPGASGQKPCPVRACNRNVDRCSRSSGPSTYPVWVPTI